MAAIVNPIAIKFSNEQVRPIAEQLRALMVKITSIETDWLAGTNAMFPNDTSVVTDNRTAEGVSILTGADVQSLMSVAIAMRNAGNTQIVAKPCVRGLTVS